MGYDNDGMEPGYAGCIQTIGNWVSFTEEYVLYTETPDVAFILTYNLAKNL